MSRTLYPMHRHAISLAGKVSLLWQGSPVTRVTTTQTNLTRRALAACRLRVVIPEQVHPSAGLVTSERAMAAAVATGSGVETTTISAMAAPMTLAVARRGRGAEVEPATGARKMAQGVVTVPIPEAVAIVTVEVTGVVLVATTVLRVVGRA